MRPCSSLHGRLFWGQRHTNASPTAAALLFEWVNDLAGELVSRPLRPVSRWQQKGLKQGRAGEVEVEGRKKIRQANKYWPDHRKYLSPEILYIFYKLFAPHSPLINFFSSGKSRKKSKQRPPKGTHPGRIQRKMSRYFFSCTRYRWKSEPLSSDSCEDAPGLKHIYPCTQSAGVVPE